ncbi:MAG: cobalt transporter CbiM [Thermoguttaceae bacterium]|nr:cobalt transporter CbiM [Thermoguttaceae bacterium]
MLLYFLISRKLVYPFLRAQPESLLMHIPDNYLSVSTCAVLTAATVPVWYRSIKTVVRDFPQERFSALGVAAACSFLAMMFNIPLPGGTTGHAVGGTVLAILLGPQAACIALTIALAIQALLFGDGGIIAFGANCFNLAFVCPFAGYYVYRALQRFSKNALVNVAVSSFVGLNLAALTTAIQFGIQPALFTDANGQALYCPYGLSVAVPAMMIGHLTLFGLAEAVFSVAVFAFIRQSAPHFSPEFANLTSETADGAASQPENNVQAPQVATQTPNASRFLPVYLMLALLIVLSPLGLLAEGTAWGEWGADEIAATTATADGPELGYTPSGLTDGFAWSAPVPDYSLAESAPGLPDWAAYVLSAIIGTALSVVLAKLSYLFVAAKRSA